MIVTNKYGLPPALVEAITNDPYSRGGADISVSQLDAPPQKLVLEREHADELTEDATERVWSLLGQTVHVILARAGADRLVETRISREIAGWKLSGQFDHFSLIDGMLTDWKVTSAWTLVYGDRALEWEHQTNAYAELLTGEGHEVTGVQVVAILRDWQRSKAREGGNYPAAQVATVPLRLWPHEERVAWIEERVRVHQAARAGSVDPCSDRDRWAKAPKWAVMKDGRKSAVKLHDSAAEAEVTIDHLRAGLGGRYSVEHRAGRNIRCESYCAAMPFCEQATRLGVTPKEADAA